MRINIDFDETLTTGEGPPFWEDEWREEPNEAMIEWVNQRYIEDNTIIVWTARPWKCAYQLAACLERWEVRYHGVRCNKGSADVYVDDKAVTPDAALNGE